MRGSPAMELLAREAQRQQGIVYSPHIPCPGRKLERQRAVAAADVEHAPGAGIDLVEQHTIASRQHGVVASGNRLDLAPVIGPEPLILPERAVRRVAHRRFLTACS